MKVIPPLSIEDGMIVDDTVVETDAYDGPLWLVGTSYAVGVKVRRPNHHSYESAAASNVGNVPEDTTGTIPPKWIDLGYTNPWRMLRTDHNQQTQAPSPIVTTVELGQRISAIGVTGLEADRIRVTTSDGYDSGYRSTRYRDTHTWFQYFKGDFMFREGTVFLNIPPTTDSTITVTIERDTGDVLVGAIFFGTSRTLGKLRDGATIGQRDFSNIDRNTFGDFVSLTPGKSIAEVSGSTAFDDSLDNSVRSTLKSQRGKVALYIGIEDPSDVRYDGLAVAGIVPDWKITPGHGTATLDFSLEGF